MAGRTIIGKAVARALKSKGVSREEFAYRVLPGFLLEIVTKYLRVNVEGISNLPKKGPYIIIANHSGYMGFDALMLGHHVYKARKVIPRIIAHKMWFIRPEISARIEKLGLVPATLDNGFKILEEGEPLMLFPEGEEGNFKPSAYRYRLRRFRRGFIRLALRTGVPIIPAAVIGAEETHITLSQIRWAKEVIGIIVPIPLNIVPLPAKWKIKFMKPIVFPKAPEKAEDMEYVTRLSREVRIKLQKEIHSQLKKRNTIFL